MRLDLIRFGMAAVFALMSALLFLRDVLAPELGQQFKHYNLTLGAWFALVLAGWNAARGYMELVARRERQTPVRSPFRHDSEENVPYERNPELDFFKTDDAELNRPSPSVNGDHKASDAGK